MPSHYEFIAFHRLGFDDEPSDVDEGIVEFMEDLCEIESELLDLGTRVAAVDIGLTGYEGTRKLVELDRELNSYIREIDSAHHAVIYGRLKNLDRYEAKEYNSGSTDRVVSEYREDFLDIVGRLEDITSRIGARLEGKRNSANTRLVLSTSVIALFLSTISILTDIQI